nr:class I SAM-dependent methyltransferase [Ferrimicrobium acidiphilum]
MGATKRALELYRLRQEVANSETVVFPPTAFADLNKATAFATQTTALQILPFKGNDGEQQTFEDAVWRDRAVSGLRIERVYVLPHGVNLSPGFSNQLRLDKDAGIRSSYVVLGRIPQTDATSSLAGIWILDDSVAVIAKGVTGSEDGSSFWTVTNKIGDVDFARSIWSHVGDIASRQAATTHDDVDLEEPLALSADIINEVAGVLCTYDQTSRDSKEPEAPPRTCSWYHSAWQYLRLLDLVSTPTWHSQFYREGLASALAERNAKKAIVTGCADYSMLAFLSVAQQKAATQTELHVLDHCPTPLFACKWYAHRLGFHVATHEEDLLKPTENIGSEYDVICADALLTRFTHQEGQSVLRLWHSMLNPGGRVITTVRVHSMSPPKRNDPEEAIQEFKNRAIQRASRWRSFLRRTPGEIGNLAEAYIRQMQSEDLGSDSEIREAFRRAGFRVDEAGTYLNKVPGELQATTYLELAAIKDGDAN